MNDASLAFAVTGGTVLLLVAGAGLVLDRYARAARLRAARAGWGRFRDRPRDMAGIAAYYRDGARDGDHGLDDRTWEDLDMDDVFQVLDRTETPLGQQHLYARLRSAPPARRLAAFDALVTRLGDDVPARERVQVALGRLATPAAFDLWRLAQPGVLERLQTTALFPAIALAAIGLAAAAPAWWPARLLLAALLLGNLALRAVLPSRLAPFVHAFRLVSPLVAAAQARVALDVDGAPGTISALSVDTARLVRLGRLARWAAPDPTAAAGDPRTLLFHALNVVLWLDVNALAIAAPLLRQRAPEVQRIVAAVGDLDAALGIASFREGTPGWTRPSFQPASALLRGLRHPLIPDAVPNSITLAPPTGAIITGSNMSGKSTFLRTVGVSVVLAQTIHTCLASHYDGPQFVVRTCIGRADDPATGKSYYLVEVDAVLAILRAAGSQVPHLMLFDELFRGTNAVERIAAAEAVLRALLEARADGRHAPHTVMVATHDDELVDLLAGAYDPYHFTDALDSKGFVYNYRLEPGRATSRNAIALLAARGAPVEVIDRATARARELDRARALVAAIPGATPDEPVPDAPAPDAPVPDGQVPEAEAPVLAASTGPELSAGGTSLN
ncbi:MAG: hypothetical protein AB7H88_19400 [Vicinamibacterales bacterium]